MNAFYFFLFILFVFTIEKARLKTINRYSKNGNLNKMSKNKNRKNNIQMYNTKIHNHSDKENQNNHPGGNSMMNIQNFQNLPSMSNLQNPGNQGLPFGNNNNFNNVPSMNMPGVQNFSSGNSINNMSNVQIPPNFLNNSHQFMPMMPNPSQTMNMDPNNRSMINPISSKNSNNLNDQINPHQNNITPPNGINLNNPNMMLPGVNPTAFNQFSPNNTPNIPLNPGLNTPNINPNTPAQLFFQNQGAPQGSQFQINREIPIIPPLNIIREKFFDSTINSRYEKIFRKLDNSNSRSYNNVNKATDPLQITIPLSELLKMAFDYKLIEKGININSQQKKGKNTSLKDNYYVLNKTPQSLIFKAQSEIKSKTNIIVIEKSLVLTVKNPAIKNTCIKISTLEQFKHNSDKICLALYLVTRLSDSENPETFHTFQEKLLSDYFRSFRENQNYKKYPVFFPKAFYSKIIAGTYFNELLKARMHLFEKEYEILIKQLKVSKTEIDLKDFVKARLYVSSRNLNIVNRQGENLSAIPILIDQIKRTDDNEKANCSFDYKGGKFYLISTRKILKGEELLLRNPRISNSDSLMNFGYTTPGNKKISEVYLYIKLNQNKETAEESPFLENEIGILLESDFNLNEVLKSFRMMQANYKKKDGETEEINYRPLSVDNEILALHVFRKSLRTKILKYPTNLESDMVIMKYKKLTENELNLYRIVIEEKYLVVFYFNMASFFEKFINKIKNAHNVDDKMIDRISKNSFYKDYYDEIKELLKTYVNDKTFLPDDSVFVRNPLVPDHVEFSVDELDEDNIHELEEEEFLEEEEDEEQQGM